MSRAGWLVTGGGSARGRGCLPWDPGLQSATSPHPPLVNPQGFQKLVTACPVLAARPELRAVMNLRAIDVIATRLYFDRRVECRFPANVLAGFERTAGATFFDLNALQVTAVGL